MNQYLIFAKASLRGVPIQLLLGLCALVVILTGCGSQSNTQNQQSTPVTLPTLQDLGQLPPGAQGAISQGTLAPNTIVQLNIGLQTNRQQLAGDLAALYDPNSPNYLHFFKPADLASRYGASQATIDQVSAFLTSQGFQIASVSKLRDSIKVKATVAQIAQAFHIALQNFQLNGQTFFGPTGQFSLPAAVKPLISYVQGLSSFAKPTHDLAFDPNTPAKGSASCNGIQGVVPGQIATAYDYTDAYKKGYYGGVNLGVVEFNDAVLADDVNGFLACTTKGAKLSYEAVGVDGGAQNPDADSSFEATLDIEYLAALAPGAHIIEYQGQACDSNPCQSNIGFAQALNDVFGTIAQDGRVAVVSVSWGAPEEAFTSDDFNAIDQQLANLDAEGVTVVISEGDCGAFATGRYNHLSIQYPGSDPSVLSVGGTILQTDGQGHRKSETVWYNSKPDHSNCGAGGGWGTGGGISQVWKEPGYQAGKGVKNKYSDGARQVPDVAAIAYHAAVLFQGQFGGANGTSIAAPVWAAGIAIVDEGLIKNKNEVLGDPTSFYAVANKAASKHPYYDVTKGNNLYYPATANWDCSTGWGTPNLFNFANAFGAFSK